MRVSILAHHKFLSVITILFLLAASTPVLAVTSADVKKAKSKADSNREKIRESEKEKSRLDNEIQAADFQLTATQSELDKILSQLEITRAEKNKITNKLNQLRSELAKTEMQLKRALVKLDELTSTLNSRADSVYKHGEITFLEVLLDARSFSDFLKRARFISTIISVDARLVADIKDTKRRVLRTREDVAQKKRQTEQQEAALAAEVTRIEGLSATHIVKKTELSTQIGAKELVISQIGEDQKIWEEAAAEYERSAAIIQAQLNAMQSAGSGSPASGSPSVSGFIWPANGSLTSNFGPRWGRMHSGIDIAAPYGAPVWAAKAGRVAIASWYGGYGNLVVIDHGGGVTTWYGHNSSFAVSVGQQVSQGQVIAGCGSTGNSTGPHVHFEIRINGSPVNPLSYLR